MTTNKPLSAISRIRQGTGLRYIAPPTWLRGATIALCAAAACLLTAPGAADSDSHQTEASSTKARGSRLSRDKDERLAAISPYRDERRWQSYLTISELFDQIWTHPASRMTIANGRTEAFPQYPLLSIDDRDADGKAEFFTYRPPDGSDRTQEFGAFFDLNGDRRPDWLVYYGGVALTNTSKGLAPFVFHYNFIDTNGDGKFDIFVFGAIDLDGDGLPDKGATAWLYDTNGDGLIDKAEHIVDGRVSPIEPQSGSLQLRRFGHTSLADEPKVGDKMPVELFDKVADDIVSLSRN